MKKEKWLVTKDDQRPAGDGVHCFYCTSVEGEPHQPECVIRSRTVVLEFRILHAVAVPEHWTIDQILFQRNDGTMCSGGDLHNIARDVEIKAALDGELPHGCCCDRSTTRFVREATEEDHRMNPNPLLKGGE